MKQVQIIQTLLLFSAGVSSAATISFADLSNITGSNNNLNVGGSNADLTVARTVDTSGAADEYVFNITYTGADYDGDLSNDTLSYSIRVAAMAGNTVSSSLNTLNTGGNSGAVTLDGSAADVGAAPGATWEGFGQGNQMASGASLIFTIENISVDVAGYEGSFDGFNSFVAQSDGPGEALAIVGTGTDLEEYYTGSNHNFSDLSETTLVVSSANPTGGGDNDWGVRYLDYGITVAAVPEPSSTALLGLGGLALIMRRRK